MIEQGCIVWHDAIQGPVDFVGVDPMDRSTLP
jgi:hypothetical protein